MLLDRSVCALLMVAAGALSECVADTRKHTQQIHDDDDDNDVGAKCARLVSSGVLCAHTQPSNRLEWRNQIVCVCVVVFVYELAPNPSHNTRVCI